MHNYIVRAAEYPLNKLVSPEPMRRLKILKSLAPFILIMSLRFYTGLLLSSSIFLFAFYNIASGGLAWSVALVMDKARQPSDRKIARPKSVPSGRRKNCHDKN
jgi:hypothetical protein